ncbi:MAG TPA: hypothetical protein VIN65_10760 [Candidatus Dormibacteraeota bacterium]
MNCCVLGTQFVGVVIPFLDDDVVSAAFGCLKLTCLGLGLTAQGRLGLFLC